jgi:hypothetical protein
LTNVNASNLNVEALASTEISAGFACCVRFRITISASLDSGVDVTATSEDITKSLGTASGWTVESTSTDSSASGLVAATCALAAAALLA